MTMTMTTAAISATTMIPAGILAQTSSDIIRPGEGLGTSSRLVMGDLLLIIAASLLVAAVLVGVALFFRNRRKRHRRRGSRERSGGESRVAKPDTEQDETGQDRSGLRRRRRRKRRRDHRRRNPTLSETGGLPPARQDPSSCDPQI